MEYQPRSGEAVVLALLHGYVPHDGDGWTYTRNELVNFVDRALESKLPKAEFVKASPSGAYNLSFAQTEPSSTVRDLLGPALPFAENVGRRIAQLHLTLLNGSGDPSFAPEVFNDFYRQGLYHANISLTGRRLEFIRQRYSDMAPDVRRAAARVLDLEDVIVNKFKAIFEQRIPSVRIRFHGRLHLGHLLVTPNDDVTIFDFEGDPALHVSERRIKRCREYAALLRVRDVYCGPPSRRKRDAQSSGHRHLPCLEPLLVFAYERRSHSLLLAYCEWSLVHAAHTGGAASAYRQLPAGACAAGFALGY